VAELGEFKENAVSGAAEEIFGLIIKMAGLIGEGRVTACKLRVLMACTLAGH